MHIAVIIPFRDRGDRSLLQWTLEGYAGQCLSGDDTLEILVGIDGGTPPPVPSPGTLSIQCLGFPRIGAAAVRNALVKKTDADVIIFGNADARPQPDMVARHAQTIQTLPVGAVVLGDAPWEKPPLPTVFDALLAETPMVFFYKNLTPHGWHGFRNVWTLNLSIRRDDFLRAGGFPEELRPVYYEDLALGFRLMGKDKKMVWYEPSARVLHRHPTTWEQYLDREELLGLMSPVLARVCPDAFEALHGTRDVQALASQFSVWSGLDHLVHQWIYKRIHEWAVMPESSLPSPPEARDRLLATIYQTHVPLKRLAFRLGFLRGMELADDAHWEQRQPAGLWRKVACP